MQILDLSNLELPDFKSRKDRLEEMTQQRDRARQTIREQIRCTEFIKPAPNHRGNTGYCCPACGSGTRRGAASTGALEYYPETNKVYCHACHWSGDPIDIYMKDTGADYNTALSLLAERAGADLLPPADKREAQRPAQNHDTSAQDTKPAGEDKTPADGAQSAAETSSADYMAYYAECRERLADPAAVSYLSARGISYETAYRNNIGYDPAADPANAPGAIGEEHKLHPCPRIVIPTSAAHYVGRRIDGKDEFAKINSRGSTPGIFNSAILNNPKLKYVFVCEGAFDALSVMETKHNAIALNSTSNADMLIKLLEQNAQDGSKTAATFILCLDNDKAGQAATEAIKEGLRNLKVSCIAGNICGKCKDPNEALINNAEMFAFMVDTAISAAKELREIEQAEEPAELPAEEKAADDLAEFFDKIQTEAYKPYKTDLSFFDDLLGGGVLRQSLLLLLAAPGTGKTTLAAQIAEQMAEHGKPVLYINLEMSKEQMLAKAISSRIARKGKVRMTAQQVLQGYNWTAAEREAVTEALQEYREKILPYLTYNPAGVSSDLAEINNYLYDIGEKAKAEGKEAPVIILDYLHLITSSRGIEQQELIKQAVLTLKDYAKSYDTFVIGIVATNRASNTAGRITLESGRDSSNLEYTADYQISLNYYDIETGKLKTTSDSYLDKLAELQQEEWRRMMIRVLKGRLCAPGRNAKVYFNAAYNMFYGEKDWLPADPQRVPFEDSKPQGNGQIIKARF